MMDTSEWLKNNIKSVIPGLRLQVVSDLVHLLTSESFGVTKFEDLSNVEEADLKVIPTLTTIQRRELLKAWRDEEYRQYLRCKDNQRNHAGRESSISVSGDSGIGSTRSSVLDRLYFQARVPGDLENSEEYATSFKRNALWLREILDPDNGLLEILLSQRFVTHEQYTNILSLKSFYKKNDAIIDIVKSLIDDERNKIYHFLYALNFNNQNHIVNLLQCSENLKMMKNKEDMPLDEFDRLYIDNLFYALGEGINVPETFLAKLMQDGVITHQHLEYIKELKTEQKRVAKLLQILRRRSKKSFYDFANAIKTELHLDELSEQLKSRALFATLHQEFENVGINQKNYETKLCCKCMQFIMEKNSIADIDCNDIKVVNFKHGNSIVIVLACGSLQSVYHLEKMNKEGNLERIFQTFFSKMGSDLKTARLRVEADHLKKARVLFEEMEVKKRSGSTGACTSSVTTGASSMSINQHSTSHGHSETFYENSFIFDGYEPVPGCSRQHGEIVSRSDESIVSKKSPTDSTLMRKKTGPKPPVKGSKINLTVGNSHQLKTDSLIYESYTGNVKSGTDDDSLYDDIIPPKSVFPVVVTSNNKPTARGDCLSPPPPALKKPGLGLRV